MGPKFDLRRCQFALSPHDFKHPLGLGLTEQYCAINFAHLD